MPPYTHEAKMVPVHELVIELQEEVTNLKKQAIAYHAASNEPQSTTATKNKLQAERKAWSEDTKKLQARVTNLQDQMQQLGKEIKGVAAQCGDVQSTM